MGRNSRWAALGVDQVPSTLSWDAEALSAMRGADVLDLGSGPRPSFDGLEHFDGRRVGVDANAAVVEAARAAAPEAVFVEADVTSLPFEDETFDLVLCKALLTALVHDLTCSNMLAQAARVLRPGGTLLLADGLYVARHFTKAQVLGWLAADPRWALESYAERGVVTRSGRPITGFVARLRRT